MEQLVALSTSNGTKTAALPLVAVSVTAACMVDAGDAAASTVGGVGSAVAEAALGDGKEELATAVGVAVGTGAVVAVAVGTFVGGGGVGVGWPPPQATANVMMQTDTRPAMKRRLCGHACDFTRWHAVACPKSVDLSKLIFCSSSFALCQDIGPHTTNCVLAGTSLPESTKKHNSVYDQTVPIRPIPV